MVPHHLTRKHECDYAEQSDNEVDAPQGNSEVYEQGILPAPRPRRKPCQMNTEHLQLATKFLL